MNTRLSAFRRALIGAATVALAAALAACGSSELTPQEFCNQAQSLYNGEEFQNSGMQTPQEQIDQFASINTKVQGITAPSEISADWEEFQRAMKDLTAAVKALDASDEEGFPEAFGNVSQNVKPPSDKSQENLETYMNANCSEDTE